MTPHAMQMTAALAVVILATGSPVLAALQPSADLRPEVASVSMPLPTGDQLSATHAKPVKSMLQQAGSRGAEDMIEAERRNLLLAPPADEALHLYVAGAVGFILIALFMVAMLSRKPGQGPSAEA